MGQQKQAPRAGRLKICIIILSVLLVLSAGGLAARMIYLNVFMPTQATVTLPDNLIREESSLPSESTANNNDQPEPSNAANAGSANASVTSRSHQADKPVAEVLELFRGKSGVNERFEVKNMFPGDMETKYFCVRAFHDKDVDLFFKTDIAEQTKNLGNVLHIKVTHMNTGKVLFDAPFSEVDGRECSELLKANGEKSTTAYYQIDVSFDTSVGNDYQAARLTANIEWYVKNGGELTPPPTGDNTNVLLWSILAVSSLLLIVILWTRGKEGVRHEQV